MWRFVAVGLYPHERRFVRLTAPTSLALFAVGVVFFHFCVLPIVLHFFVGFGEKFRLGNPEPTRFQRLILGLDKKGTEPATTQPDLPRVPILDAAPQHPEPGQWWLDRRTNQIRIATKDGVRMIMTSPTERRSVLESQFRLGEYVSFVLTLYLAFGLAFQLPIVVIFLVASDIVDAKRIARARKYVIFGIFVAAAVLTPPDVISQLFLGIPMVMLFEGGLLAARLLKRRPSTEPAKPSPG
jgi:Sec-independent protein secretion pathway component TatC